MKSDFIQIITDVAVLKFIIAFNVFVFLDTITGLVKAWFNKNVQSTKLKHGLVKFIIYWAFFMLGVMIDFVIVNDMLISKNITTINIVTKLFCCIICSIEIKSLQENFKEWNLNIPDWIIKLFNKKGNADESPQDPIDNIITGEQITIEELQNLLNGGDCE